MSKKVIAVYTATGCRVCETSLLDAHYQVHPLSRMARIAFWPYVLGSQLTDLDQLKNVDVCFFAGAIRTETDRNAAMKLRKSAGSLVAVGACAAYGGMPGLANLADSSEALEADCYSQNTSATPMPPLPALESQVMGLGQVVDVDYFVPGCPPIGHLVWAAVQALVAEAGGQTHLSYAVSRLPKHVAEAMAAGIAPRRQTTFAGQKAVCASCSRQKEEKRFKALKRPYQAYESTGRCLLEQGLICQGIATREGCGGVCTAAGVPCRGCFGKTEAIYDAGAKMVSAVSSTFDSEDPDEIRQLADQFHDMVGTFYRYTLPTQCTLLC